VARFERARDWGTLPCMLFMVIESFKDGDARAIGERFKSSGRMLPEGLLYHASWVESTGARCFQVMETTDPELLKTWISRWDDLIDFETVRVQSSAEFWAQTHPE
jgi:hypothetical protein